MKNKARKLKKKARTTGRAKRQKTAPTQSGEQHYTNNPRYYEKFT